MKKLLMLITVIICCSSLLHAQKTRFGVAAGVSFANARTVTDGDGETADSRTGFTGGFLADIPINKQFYFQPGLYWVQKGTQDETSGMGYSIKAKIFYDYLEIPLNFVYKVNQKKGNLFFGLGPSLSYGISGKVTAEVNGQKETEDINFGNGDDDDLKPFEVGGNILAGYEDSKGFFLAVNYNRTFTNPVIDGDSDNKLSNYYFGIRLGYFFHPKK